MFNRESLVDQNEVIVDEKRRLAVNARNLTYFQNNLYMRNYFKSLRPDLNSLDYCIWQEKWKLGEQYLNEVSRVFNREVFRMSVQTPISTTHKKMLVKSLLTHNFSIFIYKMIKKLLFFLL